MWRRFPACDLAQSTTDGVRNVEDDEHYLTVCPQTPDSVYFLLTTLHFLAEGASSILTVSRVPSGPRTADGSKPAFSSYFFEVLYRAPGETAPVGRTSSFVVFNLGSPATAGSSASDASESRRAGVWPKVRRAVDSDCIIYYVTYVCRRRFLTLPRPAAPPLRWSGAEAPSTPGTKTGRLGEGIHFLFFRTAVFRLPGSFLNARRLVLRILRRCSPGANASRLTFRVCRYLECQLKYHVIIKPIREFRVATLNRHSVTWMFIEPDVEQSPGRQTETRCTTIFLHCRSLMLRSPQWQASASRNNRPG